MIRSLVHSSSVQMIPNESAEPCRGMKNAAESITADQRALNSLTRFHHRFTVALGVIETIHGTYDRHG